MKVMVCMRLPNGYGSVVKLSGKRRKPYIVRKTVGWKIDEVTKKKKQEYVIIGYAPTKADGLQMLADYNKNPYDINASKITFEEVFKKWSEKKFSTCSDSNIKGYNASYKLCGTLYNKIFKEIKLVDLQYIIDSCGKNYPTLRKLKVLFNQLYDYALMNEICNKDYSQFVDILQYKDKNPNQFNRKKFSDEQIKTLWDLENDRYYQIILMLIYNGVRISEFLNLKKEDINLEKRFFDVIDSKTENGIRKVPIAEKVFPFYQWWYKDHPECPYFIHTEDGKQFKYRNYYDSYFKPIMDNFHWDQTPHCCRHTCISLLAAANVNETIIKKIVGHSGAMSLSEKVYTHFDPQELVDAINKI
ncbi:tyrosine-type recombinase/integrase [Eubacterium callanderi]|uniref:tyrosine-type recombinase/integrase n=2 Tax=Eubacteriaceae TaxID=186806 RepID=UPI0034E52113